MQWNFLMKKNELNWIYRYIDDHYYRMSTDKVGKIPCFFKNPIPIYCLVEPVVHHHDPEEDAGNVDHHGEPGVGVVLPGVAQHGY